MCRIDVIQKAKSQPGIGDILKCFLNRLKKAASKCPTRPPWQGPLLPYYEAAPRLNPQDDKDLLEFASIEGDWLYPDHYQEEPLNREYGEGTGECFKENLAEWLTKELGRQEVEFQPSNYLAVIAADGDEMGKWFTGRKDRESFDREWHAKLSGALTDFSQKDLVQVIEGSMPAKLVYGGGDDLLAFVPKARLLEAIRKISDAFTRCTASADPGMTLSFGCVLARHNDPLSAAIQKAQELLKKKAKEEFGRAAFAVWRTTGGGEAAGLPLQFIDRLDKIYQAMRFPDGSTSEGRLSPRIVPALERFMDGLGLNPKENGRPFEPGRRQMVGYLAARHFEPSEPRDEEKRKSQRRVMAQDLQSLYDGICAWQKKLAKGKSSDPLDVLLNLLAMLRFLTREER